MRSKHFLFFVFPVKRVFPAAKTIVNDVFLDKN